MSEYSDDQEDFVEFEVDSDDIAIPSSSDSSEYSDDDEVEAPAESTVLYIGHLPFGFFEDELRGFFSQYGKVRNVKVARSSRSTRCKGYGWVQFAEPHVAAIAAKAMDGYMLFRKKLVVKVLPADQVGKKLFRNSKRKMLPSRRPAIHKAQQNAAVTDERLKKLEQVQQRKERKRNKKFAELGIDYSFGAVEETNKKAKTNEKDKANKKSAPPAPQPVKAKKKKGSAKRK